MNTNTEGLTPVTPLEVMKRINVKLEEHGLELRPHPTGFSICNERGKAQAVNVCLDSLAIEEGVLGDAEFLCWPEEAKAA